MLNECMWTRLTSLTRAGIRHAAARSAVLTAAASAASAAFPRCYIASACPPPRSRGCSGIAAAREQPLQEPADDFAWTLPVVCPGCGGLSQTVDSDAAGFYSPKKRNRPMQTREPTSLVKKREAEEAVWQQAVEMLAQQGHSPLPAATVETTSTSMKAEKTEGPLLCDRCHDLVHQSRGQPILHPSIDSIRAIIESSPHRDNHIYHVLDAADFPMSLIPNLVSSLDLPRLRTQNRRSKSRQYIRGRTADVSFIITRSDLLAPRKEDVDRMMPYLQEVLRDSLGRAGKNLRLGNVRCVSAKRGWWTPSVKDEIWKRGGAGWVVGKVNVGKSALFEVVYPKGRSANPEVQAKLQKVRQRGALNPPIGNSQSLDALDQSDVAGIGDSMLEASESRLHENLESQVQSPVVCERNALLKVDSQPDQLEQPALAENEIWDEDEDETLSMLPPAQPETEYPHMPIVSSLPGTTAAPIRIPFGQGKGELVDLPGVQRSSMETHIKPEHRSSLVMTRRIVPEQFVLHSGRSLVLGGIIRITPKTENVTFLVYPFTQLTPHATRNDKAVAIQTGINEDGSPYDGTVENIGTDTAKNRIKSAGVFTIQWNATKKRTGSLTDRTAGKQKADELPFIVYSADVLIEGVGWVEIACQVRNRKKSLLSDALSTELGRDVESNDVLPEVEVFSPKGKFIGIRRPMNAYITGGPRRMAKHARRKRPRMSISYQKRMEGGRKGGQTKTP